MRGHFEDMTGRRFGRLVILEELKHNKIKCQCDCGKIVILTKTKVLNGNTQSCGCFNRDKSAESLRSLSCDGGKMFIGRLKSDKPQSSNTTSGIKGVCYDKSRGLWSADIQIRGNRFRLGRFAKLEDAAVARKQAEEKYFTPVIEEANKNGNDRSPEKGKYEISARKARHDHIQSPQGDP